MEIARAKLDAAAPLVTSDPETTLDDLIADPKHKHAGQLSDDELMRDAVREVAIGTTILSREITERAVLPDTDLPALAPIVRAIAACLDALPGAFEQALTLKATKERPSFEAKLCASDWDT